MRADRVDAGFAGLSELAVAMLFMGVLLPLVGMGLANGYRFATSITERAASASVGGQLLTQLHQQLLGAQPLAYCTSLPGVDAGDGTPGDPASMLEVPLADCAQTGLGPPPPDGESSWDTEVSSLPEPSPTSCGTPVLTAGALVTATATCVGFFSYDFEQSNSPTAATGALSSSGPFTPPELTYLWVCHASCPAGSAAGTLWLTYYAPTGSYTNAGCSSPDQPCSDPDWSTAPRTTRYLGQVGASDGAVFTYAGPSNAAVALDQSLVPPGVAAASLQGVLVVTVTATHPSLGGSGPNTTSVSVPITGNVYQSSTSGNG